MTAINIILNETRKGLIIIWDYKFNMLMQMFGILFIFVGIMFFVGQGNITPEQVTSTILGAVITFYVMESISSMSWELMSEAQAGTLEQMYMSPVPTQLVIIGRYFASMISATIQMLIICTALILLFQVPIQFSWSMIPIFLLTIPSLLGIGYLVGGLTLVFKQIGPVANLIQNLMMISNGTFLPVAFMPAWMALLVKFLPSTLGIILIRRAVLEDVSLASMVGDGSLLILVLHSIGFFIIGWLGFAFCENIARKQGSLGQY